MDDLRRAVATMRAVTVSREYGSGGGEIAARLAERLGWQLIDHEIVVRVAGALQISEAAAAREDEHAEGALARLLATMQAIGPAEYGVTPLILTTSAESYRRALREVVEAAAEAGHAVIVGRGSQVILAARRDVLHVRVVAPVERRVAYVVRREGLDDRAARARVHLKDGDRRRYLQFQHHIRADDPLHYDLIVNTAVLDLDDAVDLIGLALTRKANRLTVPVADLGPAAGQPPYPGEPGDIRPPVERGV
ncbi:MAG TPA: cytidylate kinase-like family protein [Thermomicrobiales bacterium]|nr:cytidylate kinase-like family protein [Thermomicrobiales bacterium]